MDTETMTPPLPGNDPTNVKRSSPLRSVLVVDDDKDFCQSLILFFSEEEIELEVAENGREGLRRLAENQYDLIITDIIMPDVEGIEFIMKIREDLPTIPILALSGGGAVPANDYLGNAVDLGANDALRKPVKAGELIRKVEGLLQG